MDNIYDWRNTDETQGESFDPVVDGKLNKGASTGMWQIQKMMEGIMYAGTGTKQEIVELENNMRQLLELRIFPYKYIENQFMMQGYPQKAIRNVFEKITGIKPDAYNSSTYDFMMTPAEIPSINLGWGESKDKKYNHYFVMPWQIGYSVFGQKDAFTRDEVKGGFLDLEEAREFVKKKVKEYRQFDQVYDGKLDKVDEYEYGAFSEPVRVSTLSSQGKAVYDFVKMFSDFRTVKSKLAYIKDSYLSGNLPSQDFKTIVADLYRNAEPDIENIAESGEKSIQDEVGRKVKDQEELINTKPVDEILQVKSPRDFFQDNTDTTGGKSLTHIIESTENYIDKKASELQPDYSISIAGQSFIKADVSDRMEENVQMESQQIIELLKSSGTVAVILTIRKNSMMAEDGVKTGFMVFSIINGELQTTGDIKFKDKTFSLSKEGLDKYFATSTKSEPRLF